MEGVSVKAELLIIVAALYLFECIRWVGRGSVVLRSFVPGLWSFSPPWQVATQWKRALALAAPWPPFGGIHIIDGLPFTLGPRGVTFGGRHPAGWSRPGASAVHVKWEDAKRITFEESEVLLDGKPVVALGTRRATRALRRLFREIAQSKPERREHLLERFLARRMDLEEVRKRRVKWRKWSWQHLFMAHVLLFTLFGALYLVLYTEFFLLWRLILTAALLVWTLTALAYDLALYKVLPDTAAPPLGRRLATLVSPMALIRSPDELRAELYGDLDALAVGSLYVSHGQLEGLGRRRLAELSYPIEPPEGLAAEDAVKDEAWLRARYLARTQKLLRALELEPDELLKPTFRPDGGSVSFCPRCQSQYTNVDGLCANCPGVPLQPFSPARQEQAA